MVFFVGEDVDVDLGRAVTAACGCCFVECVLVCCGVRCCGAADGFGGCWSVRFVLFVVVVGEEGDDDAAAASSG